MHGFALSLLATTTAQAQGMTRIKLDTPIWMLSTTIIDESPGRQLDETWKDSGFEFGQGGRAYGGYVFDLGLELGVAVAFRAITETTDQASGSEWSVDTSGLRLLPQVGWNQPLADKWALYVFAMGLRESVIIEPDSDAGYGFDSSKAVFAGGGGALGLRYSLTKSTTLDFGGEWLGAWTSQLDIDPGTAKGTVTAYVTQVRTGMSVTF